MSSTLQPPEPSAPIAAQDAPALQAAPAVPATLTPRVKICGITNLADAELSVELGAWTLGMIFYERSPRRCSIEQALQVTSAMRRRVQLCGVFVNASLDEIVRVSEELGLSMVQLHGDEGPAFCEEVRRRTGALIVKAAQVAVPGDVRDLERFHVDYHLLDTRSLATSREGMRGGTGETFDWELARARRSSVPLILSGGLHAGNVLAAIAATHPYAVDSASGTESSPGHKDPEKLRALFDALREAQAQAAALEQSARAAAEPVTAAQIGDAA